ncbi:hypothetical protein MBAV_004047 [Candidatus Magnetobacterium bavaricum]|uniref:Uncharacterized protein n=1 Tax=Candidatus Magnetobacterium bavaricum TaxID=29290 RepID=A0A0F3GPE3_9BACT|nr:hypothetical protein MBAV_004047 [Candidatus Magnetobacterium bavaricum]
MLAYILVHEFNKRTAHLKMTTEYMIDVLDKIQTIEISLAGKTIKRIPTPQEDANIILNALGVKLPTNTVNIQGKKSDFTSMLLFGMSRELLDDLGRFDEDVAFFNVDTCLLAKTKGYKVIHCQDSLGILFKYTLFFESYDFRYHKMDWKKYVNFFARWYGHLEKNDDFISFAKGMLKE